MRWIAPFLMLMLAACAGMKVLKEPPPPAEKPKPGVTWGGSPIGKFEVHKVGFWCDARHGAFTFGEFGPTEDEARAKATGLCRKAFKDGPGEIASCKPEDGK